MKQACIMGSALFIYCTKLFLSIKKYHKLDLFKYKLLTVHLYSLISGQSFTEKHTRWSWRQLRRGKINKWINKLQLDIRFVIFILPPHKTSYTTFKIFTCVLCQSIGHVIYRLTHCGSRLQKMCFSHLTHLWEHPLVCLSPWFLLISPQRLYQSTWMCFLSLSILSKKPPSHLHPLHHSVFVHAWKISWV